MPDRLPELFDPLEYVEKKRRIRGSLSLAGMDRLKDVLADTGGEARIDLHFGRDGRLAILTGTVEADLPLQCQNCLETLVFPVRTSLRLGVVGSIDEADRLPEDCEPLLLETDGHVSLADIVQDELLLAVPTIPRHRDCPGPDQAEASAVRKHPFASLASLKKPTEE